MFNFIPIRLLVCSDFKYLLPWTRRTIQNKVVNYSTIGSQKIILLKLIQYERKRNFSNASQFKEKLFFMENENDYAYQIVNKLPITKVKYQLTNPSKNMPSLEEFNTKLNQKWRLKPAKEIVQCFIDSADYCRQNNISIADSRFDNLVDGLLDHVEYLTDEQLSHLMQCLAKYPLTESLKSHNFHELWSALDDVCCWKLPNWNLDSMFHFAELWYNLHLAKVSDFVFEVTEKVTRKIDCLSKEEIIASFFYLKVNKRQTVPFDYRDSFERFCTQMTIDEMALCAMALNNCKSTLRSPKVTSTIIAELIKDRKIVSDISVKALCQLLRLSSNPALANLFNDLLDHLTEEIDRLSNLSCLHMALLGTGLEMFHERSLTKISHKLVKDFRDVNRIRLKEIERLLLVLTMFDFDPKTEPDIFKVAYEEIHEDRRIPERIRHPKCLPCTLYYLSFKGIYSYELMNTILDHDYLVETFGKNAKSIPRELFYLDPCIELECPDYKGNRLDAVLRQKLTKWNTEYTPDPDKFRKKLTAAEQLTLDVINKVGIVVGGTSFYHTDHVLPHFAKAVIVVCKNVKTGQFVEIEGFEKYSLGDIMYPPKKNDCVWYAIEAVGWNSTIRDSSTLMGLTKMKKRHLEKAGYIPIFIIWNEFMQLSDNEKLNFIINKIC